MKILLTGSNGFVGQKMLYALKKSPDLTVLGVSRAENKCPLTNSFRFEQLDVTNRQAVEACFKRYRPDAVIHTAALSLADHCEKYPEECWQTNVLGTELLVAESQKYGSHLIHLSTDFVFDGKMGPYTEDDSPNPLSRYGKSKLASEQVVMKAKTPWTIVRTILVYGTLPVMPRPNIIHFVKKNLENKHPIRMTSDQIRTPTLAEDLAKECIAIARQCATGIFHISGNEPISVYEFSKKIARVFSLDESLILPILTRDLNEVAQRPLKTGFITTKIEKLLGAKPTPLDIGLEFVRDQFASSYDF